MIHATDHGLLSGMITAATEHPDVAEAAAFLREGADGTALTVAVVAQDFANPVEIREYLRPGTAGRAVTLTVALVPHIPRDPGDRVNEEELAALTARLADTQRSVFVPPASPTEETLSELIAEVTGMPGAGVLDDFLDLGGTSVSTITLSSLIDQRYGVSLRLEDVFEASHARGMARLVEQELARRGESPSEALTPHRGRVGEGRG